MEPPEDAIETATSFFWIDDGIVRVQRKAVPPTAESTAAGFDIISGLIGGHITRPVLIDFGDDVGFVTESWAVFVAGLEPLFVAIAAIGNPETMRELRSFAGAIDRLLVPFQVFTDEAEALAYLREFLPSEQPNLEPPDDAVETAAATVWFDGGILFEQSNGLQTTSETVTALFVVFRDLIGGIRSPLFFDARKWPGGAVGAWTTFLAEQDSTLTAVGVLLKPGSQSMDSPFFVERVSVPTRDFTDAVEALAFVTRFLPDE